jgi:hypothetical protein
VVIFGIVLPRAGFYQRAERRLYRLIGVHGTFIQMGNA